MSKLYDILKPHTIELLRIAWTDAEEGGLVSGTFTLENEQVQRVLTQLAQRVKGIDDTTRTTIQMIIGRQAEEGWSIDRVREELQERAVTESKTRAEVIARTESATGYVQGNILAWRESGQVTGKEWIIGPDSCPECVALNGRVVGIDEDFADGVSAPPQHPNCTCDVLPVLS